MLGLKLLVFGADRGLGLRPGAPLASFPQDSKGIIRVRLLEGMGSKGHSSFFSDLWGFRGNKQQEELWASLETKPDSSCE